MITHEIIGDDRQAVVVAPGAGDEIRAEVGAMTYMIDIEKNSRMPGGILGGLIRKFLAGESLFLSSAMICQRGSFLGAIGDLISGKE